MSQLSEITKAQQSLEELVTRKMEELQAQLQCGSAKDTVAKVAEEFRTFRDLTYAMLSLLRKRIFECLSAIDMMECSYRVAESGVPEHDGENCSAHVLNIIHSNLGVNDVTTNSFKACHRLGSKDPMKTRPILVKFTSFENNSTVWGAKTKLKGTSTSLKEFLTKPRQALFGKARFHFGLRACWAQEGVVVIKTNDGKRHKVMCMEELQPLMSKYPKVTPGTSFTSKE